MISPKNIGIASAVGFVFSFLVGMFSGIGFGHIMLRALLSAVVFGVLGGVVSFLFQHFLSDTSDSGFEASASSSEGEHGSGGLVNITIDDETLADDASEPKFAVENAHAMTGDSPEVATPSKERVSEAQTVSAAQAAPVAAAVPEHTAVVSPEEPIPEEAETAAFKPISLVAEEAPQQTAQPTPSGQGEPSTHSGGTVLDELPDIGNALPDFGKSTDKEVISDSDFATGKEEPPVDLGSASRGSNAAPVEQNAAVMAQAIQTLLAKEN